MRMTRWLRKMVGPLMQDSLASRRGKRRQRPRPLRCFAPTLETLEDRTLLSGTAIATPPAMISISGIGFAAATTTATDSVPRIQVSQARQDVTSGHALLVCAYASQYAYQQNNLQGSISLQQFQALAPSLPKNQEVIFYCGCVQDAGAVGAAQTTQGAGFTKVMVLDGGINAWKAAGYAVADPSYAAGSTVPIFGIGFAAGEVVDLQVTHIDGTANNLATEPHWTEVADATGAITSSWIVSDPHVAGSRFEITVTGENSHSGAFATFAGVAASATVSTDRYDYQPGTTATITGSGFAAGETVTLQVLHIDGVPNTDASHNPWTVKADPAGFIHTTWTVDTEDALDSRLAVSATGLTSHVQAVATFTDSAVQRPFWIFGHNPNSDAITDQYLSMGVNALEPDVEYFPDHSTDTTSKGFYIAHQVGSNPLSNYSDPNLSLHDYLDHLSQHLSGHIDADGNFVHTNNTQLSLVELDVKTEAAQATDALKYIISTINTEILPNHPELYFLINVGTIADGNSLFTMKADDALKDIPAASRSHFGFSIDGENDPVGVRDTLRNKLGADANIAYGDGTSGCCGVYGDTAVVKGVLGGTLGLAVIEAEPEIALVSAIAFVAGQFIYAGPNTPASLQHAVEMRAAGDGFNMIAYGFSMTGIDSMKMLIDSGVDGMIPADSLDITSPFSIYGFSAKIGGAQIGTQSYADTQDALNLVNGHYGGTFMATTADDPFATHGGTTTLSSGATATATVDTTSGQVTGVTINNGGTYPSVPSVYFSGGGGSGAAGTATIDAAGHVTGVTLTNHGTGYTSAPTVYLYSFTTTSTGTRNGYDLEVKTSDILGAGTDAHLTFTLHGKKNGVATSASITIDSQYPNEMERNDTNYVFIPSGDLGDLQSVTVFNDGSGGLFSIFNSEWNLDYVNVRSEAYLGKGAFLHADFGGVDVGNPTCISFGLLGTLCFDTADENPSTRAFSTQLTATSQATTTGGVEGVTAATLSGATFHDSITATTASQFSITVADWGDGSTDTAGLTISADPNNLGSFIVHGSHLYHEDGSFAFSITIQANTSGDDNGKSATIRGEADVDDIAVVLTARSFAATEGTLSSVQTLATFTDPGGAEDVKDYAVEVDWGNGSLVTDANVSISNPVNGVFSVTGKHLYADEDGYPGPVQVRIIHEQGRTTEDGTPNEFVSLVSVPLTLTDPPVSVTAAAGPFRATEGTLSPVQTLATFTDPGGAETVPEYSVDVDWGNGTFVSGGANVTISAPSNGVFTVTGKHLYVDEDTYTGPVRVRINHEDATPSPVVSVTLSLIDPPVVATAAAGPFRATEGTISARQTLATFTDPGGPEIPADYVVDVDWGNGTFALADQGVTISTPVNGVFTVTAQHLYYEEDGFPGPVRIRINHEDSTPSPVVSVPLNLTDPPLIAVGNSITLVRGTCPIQTLATFSDPGGAEPNLFDSGPIGDHYTARVHWGDGTPDEFVNISYNGVLNDRSLTNTFTVSGQHDYTTNGTYTITVTLHHEGAVPDAVVTTKVTVVSLLNHSQGYGDPNALVIGAALRGSTILVVPSGKQTGALTDAVQVLIDGVAQVNTATGGTTFTGFNSIAIYGQAGNDNLEVAGSVKKNAYIFGSGGKDRVKGGAGNNILVGGAGDDQLLGGTGRDILIGGGGNDQLVGGPGGDILIAGTTDFDNPCDYADIAVLRSIQTVWTNPLAAFNAREAAVVALFSTNGTNAAHIHYSGSSKLTGSAGQDLFFDALLDPLTGKPRGKK